MPSVYVVHGSRGQIAKALQIDVVVDDRPENCLDVVLESQAGAILVWRGQRESVPASARRMGIAVVPTVAPMPRFARRDRALERGRQPARPAAPHLRPAHRAQSARTIQVAVRRSCFRIEASDHRSPAPSGAGIAATAAILAGPASPRYVPEHRGDARAVHYISVFTCRATCSCVANHTPGFDSSCAESGDRAARPASDAP